MQSRSAFTSLGMKAEWNCESGTTALLQSRQKGSAEAELPIIDNEGRVLMEKPIFRLSESAEAKLQIFGHPGRDEIRKLNFTSLEVRAEQVRKRNLRSFEVLAERSAESRTSDVWLSTQYGSVERKFIYLAVKAERKC